MWDGWRAASAPDLNQARWASSHVMKSSVGEVTTGCQLEKITCAQTAAT